MNNIQEISFGIIEDGLMQGLAGVTIVLAPNKGFTIIDRQLMALLQEAKHKRILIKGRGALAQQLNWIRLFSQFTEKWRIEMEVDGTIMPDHDIRKHISHYRLNLIPARPPKEDCMMFFGSRQQTYVFLKAEDESGFYQRMEMLQEWGVTKDRVVATVEARSGKSARERLKWLQDICYEYDIRCQTNLKIVQVKKEVIFNGGRLTHGEKISPN